MNNRIYLASPHMGGFEKNYIDQAFKENWIAPLGSNVDGFEQEIAQYVNCQAATALISGTAAIHLALKALGVGEGDRVFCSDLTFSASCNPILYEQAIPVLIDSEPDTWCMSPQALAKAFEQYTPKAVIVVHLYGQSADMDAIKTLCDAHGVPIIEDAAESLGATYKGRMTGTIGDLGIYSFNGNKIITTSGGGMLVSDNQAYIDKARFWATQSREKERHYQHQEIGYNYRLSNICAGIGRGQLLFLGNRIEEKKDIYQTYKNAFQDIDQIQMMPIAQYGRPNYWLSAMTLAPDCSIKPLDIILALEADNIESRPIWKPMHLQPIFSQYPFVAHNKDGSSVGQDIFERGLCLPSDTKMSIADLERVINIIKGLWYT